MVTFVLLRPSTLIACSLVIVLAPLASSKITSGAFTYSRLAEALAGAIWAFLFGFMWVMLAVIVVSSPCLTLNPSTLIAHWLSSSFKGVYFLSSPEEVCSTTLVITPLSFTCIIKSLIVFSNSVLPLESFKNAFPSGSLGSSLGVFIESVSLSPSSTLFGNVIFAVVWFTFSSPKSSLTPLKFLSILATLSCLEISWRVFCSDSVMVNPDPIGCTLSVSDSALFTTSFLSTTWTLAVVFTPGNISSGTPVTLWSLTISGVSSTVIVFSWGADGLL